MVSPSIKPVVARMTAGAPTRAMGVARSARPPTMTMTPRVGPIPSLRATQPARKAPAKAPTLLNAKTTPTTPADRWSWRYANTRKTAPKTIFDPRLVVAVQAAIRQRIGFRKTTSIPSRISGMKPAVPDAVLGLGSGSDFLIEASAIAERRNDSASTATAGPATCAVDRVISSLVLPSIRLGRSTSAGRYDWYDTSKKTVKIPVSRATK